MNWDAIGFDWNHARALLATAEAGSLSGAARILGTTQPTIGRQMAALEAELGVTLFERVGRGLRPTEACVELVEHVRTMADAALRLSRTAAGRSETVEGIVRVSASEVITAHLLPPIVERVLQDHPRLSLDLIADNRSSDLRLREADIAVRNFRPTDPELIARRLPPRRGHMYASPAYLERIGPVTTPQDLQRARFFGFDRSSFMIEYLNKLGLGLTLDHFSIVCPSHLVHWEYCKRGLGVAFIMEEIGEAEPAVQRIEVGLPPIPVEMWITSHREVRTSRRVRLVFDRLVEELGAPADHVQVGRAGATLYKAP